MQNFDVIIIGAGPAGSCLARLMGNMPGLRVALLDARQLDAPYTGTGRIKSCGGLMAPDAQKALACMDMSIPAHLLVTPQLFAVRTLDVSSGLVQYYQRFYLNLDREAFDRWMFAAVCDRVQKFVGTVVKTLEEDVEGYIVTCADGLRLHGRFIVGADGANSVVRRKLFPSMPLKRYISIQERFESNRFKPHFAAFFDPTVTDYYGWGLPKNNEYLLGVAIPAAAGAEEKFQRFKERIRPFGYELGCPLYRETTLLLRPESMPSSGVLQNGKACLLGEAGGFISPSSAEGFSYAFRMAMALYRSLLQTHLFHTSPDFFGQVCLRYEQLLRPLRFALWSKIMKQKILYTPMLRYGIMRSGIQALPRIEQEHC